MKINKNKKDHFSLLKYHEEDSEDEPFTSNNQKRLKNIRNKKENPKNRATTKKVPTGNEILSISFSDLSMTNENNFHEMEEENSPYNINISELFSNSEFLKIMMNTKSELNNKKQKESNIKGSEENLPSNELTNKVIDNIEDNDENNEKSEKDDESTQKLNERTNKTAKRVQKKYSEDTKQKCLSELTREYITTVSKNNDVPIPTIITWKHKYLYKIKVNKYNDLLMRNYVRSKLPNEVDDTEENINSRIPNFLSQKRKKDYDDE